MTIKYPFVTGEVVEVNVDDQKICEAIKECVKKENRVNKRHSRNNISADSAVYEGKEYGCEDSYFDKEHQAEEAVREQAQIDRLYGSLTEIQAHRLDKLRGGMTITEIAKEEKVSVQSVYDSVNAIRNKAKKIFTKDFTKMT